MMKSGNSMTFPFSVSRVCADGSREVYRFPDAELRDRFQHARETGERLCVKLQMDPLYIDGEWRFYCTRSATPEEAEHAVDRRARMEEWKRKLGQPPIRHTRTFWTDDM